jgi:uncharacterized protein DUF5977
MNRKISYKAAFLLMTALYCMQSTNAQVDQSLENLRNVMPPSPNASSLGKFGEWPVSLYTGIPGINIPIYELKGRSMSLPISIDYHASGIRVGDIASWVGLGWALNAGGCISRSVQGLPDEMGYFVTAQNYSNGNNFCSSPKSDTVLWETTSSAAQGTSDTQQDTYNLSVLGKSYKILFNADGSAQTMPVSNIKITSTFINNPANQSGVSSSWQLLLEDGTKLIFGGSESSSTPFVEMTTSLSLNDTYISAWYLQSMTSPTGETINFTYTQSTVIQDVHFTQSDFIMYCTLPPCTFGYSGSTSSHAENSTVTQLSLSTIESDLARIYFVPTTALRQDLSGNSSLAEIKVLSKLTNAYVEDWIFNYSYSQAVSGNELPGGDVLEDTSYFHYRLKLMGLTRKAMDNTPSQNWSFSYNPLNLPSRRSFAQDHWGFYNGATTNISLMPKVQFLPTCGGTYLYGFMGGTSGDAGQVRWGNETYMQAEMLTNIYYPTGGHTVFNYEANQQQANLEVFGDTTVNQHLYLTYNQNPFVDTQYLYFNITKPEYVYATLSSTISQSVLNDFPGAKVSLDILDSAGNWQCGLLNNGAGWFNMFRPGHYILRFWSNCPQNVFMGSGDVVNAYASFRFFPSHGIQNVKQLLGGVRINSIQEYDGISASPINSKYYSYGSAFVISPVDTVNDYVTSQYVYQTSGYCSGSNDTKVTRNTSTKYALGSIQGGTVGYGKVTTYNGWNGINGYTVSQFTCDAITLPTSVNTTFPYPPKDPRDWRNGLLTSEVTYTATGVRLKSTSNTYNIPYNYNPHWNFKVGFSTIGQPQYQCAGLGLYGGCGSQSTCYTITNEQVRHTSTSQVIYNTATGDSIITVTNYYYDDTLNMQPVRTVTSNSRGDSVVTYQRTALELPAINASIPLTTSAIAAIDTMISRNIVGTPIESEKYIRSALTDKALTNYQLQSSGYVLPNNVMVQNAGNPIETRVVFPRYDSKGNLLEQMKASDVKHDYIWDYRGTYPVAEVVGADSSSIAYTSFEADGTGYWTVPSTARDSLTPAITGYKSYNLSNGAISTSIALSSAKTYTVSYWSKSGAAYTVTNGGTPKQGKTITVNGTPWTYFEHTITGVTSISVSGSSNIDELRLYLSGAQMTTYTYNPLIGISSQCDINNRITYYQYDGFNRLYTILDQDRNVLKKFCYNYYGQSIACSQFYNHADTGTYQMACSPGYTGTYVKYIVPAGKYASLVSQAAADSLAQNDVTVNGQAYANNPANGGTCTATGFAITASNLTGLSGFTATFTNLGTEGQTVLSIPAGGGNIGTIPAGSYKVVIAKTGNTTTKYIYTVCTSTLAAAVTGTFNSITISSSCNTLSIDTVN